MSFFGDLFKKKDGETITQAPMTTEEQDQARKLLAQFMQTGQFGDYKAGEAYDGSLGDFNMSDAEGIGQSQLLKLISGALPEGFTMGQDELKSVLASDKYDPYEEGGIYKGYKTNVLREAGDAKDQLARELSITGDTYSDNRAKQLGVLGERTTGLLNNKLAELYQNYGTQRLGAAQGLITSGIQEEGLNQNRINLASTIGSLPRLLADAQAKAQYAEWQRQHTEQSEVVDAAKTLFQKDVPYGIKSYTTPDRPSTFMSMFGEINPLVGSYNTHNYGYTTNQTSIGQALQAALKAMNFGAGGGGAASAGFSNTAPYAGPSAAQLNSSGWTFK